MWLSGIEVGHYTFMKLLIWDIWLQLTEFFRFDETNIACLPHITNNLEEGSYQYQLECSEIMLKVQNLLYFGSTQVFHFMVVISLLLQTSCNDYFQCKN